MAASAQVRGILALSILAGLIAGGVLAALYLLVLQPFTDLLADSIIDELIAEGEFDEDDFDSQQRIVYLGQTVGSAVAGLAAGAFIGGACILSKRDPSFTNAVLISGVAWFVLFVVPAAKYPSSPTAIFSDVAAAEYYQLYFGYLAVSGLAALVVVAGFRTMQRRNKIFGMAAVYLVAVAVAYFVFPPYDRDSTFDQSLLNQWQTLVSAAMTAFWFSAGIIAGLLWKYGSVKGDKRKGK